MRVVHPVCVNLSEDDVLWFWHGAPWGTTVCGLNHSIRSSFYFLGVFVSYVLAIPNLARPSKYGFDLSLTGRIFSVAYMGEHF